jgi:hypothetical protein
MSVRHLPRAKRDDVWRINIYIGENQCFDETFYGTEADARERESMLRTDKEAGQLTSNNRFEKLKSAPPGTVTYAANAPETHTFQCYDRDYRVIWGKPTYGQNSARAKLAQEWRPDLVQDLGSRTVPPTPAEIDAVVLALQRELEWCTGARWIIPMDVIDWGV